MQNQIVRPMSSGFSAVLLERSKNSFALIYAKVSNAKQDTRCVSSNLKFQGINKSSRRGKRKKNDLSYRTKSLLNSRNQHRLRTIHGQVDPFNKALSNYIPAGLAALERYLSISFFSEKASSKSDKIEWYVEKSQQILSTFKKLEKKDVQSD